MPAPAETQASGSIRCGVCGYASSEPTPDRRIADLMGHLKDHLPYVAYAGRHRAPATGGAS